MDDFHALGLQVERAAKTHLVGPGGCWSGWPEPCAPVPAEWMSQRAVPAQTQDKGGCASQT